MRASAFSKARYRLKHTAFVELNRKAVVETLYGDGDYRRYRGWRLLGIDGSKVLLPDSETVREEFGTTAFSNGKDGTGTLAGERPYALASVLYDLCNGVALDARLERANAYAVDLAVAHLAHAGPGDLVLADRNYPFFRMLAELSQRGIDFAIRCFNAIKHNACDILFGDEDAETICKRLTALFLTNPTTYREGRAPPRKNTSDRGLLDYHRRRRKHCY